MSRPCRGYSLRYSMRDLRGMAAVFLPPCDGRIKYSGGLHASLKTFSAKVDPAPRRASLILLLTKAQPTKEHQSTWSSGEYTLRCTGMLKFVNLRATF